MTAWREHARRAGGDAHYSVPELDRRRRDLFDCGQVTDTLLENPGAPDTPQRIAFTVQVSFTDTSAFTAETRQIFAQASLAGLQDVAVIELLKQPNPYMMDGATSWLSTDVRVFQLRPGEKINSSNVTLGNPDSNVNAPFTYIQGLLGELRGNGNNPAAAFENISQDEQASQLELSRTVNGQRVLNFAVAKVRYRAQSQDASDVRVFFRTFNTMVSDLSYTTNALADVQNYRRTTAGTIPLLGTNEFFSGAGNQITSVPYFAECADQFRHPKHDLAKRQLEQGDAAARRKPGGAAIFRLLAGFQPDRSAVPGAAIERWPVLRARADHAAGQGHSSVSGGRGAFPARRDRSDSQWRNAGLQQPAGATQSGDRGIRQPRRSLNARRAAHPLGKTASGGEGGCREVR